MNLGSRSACPPRLAQARTQGSAGANGSRGVVGGSYHDPVTGSSDADLETGVIGGPTLHDDTIRLVEHDSAWPERFEREAARIRATLGPAALGVDHVGSTSVPGLAAKPIIDIRPHRGRLQR